jgi:hypothetical protein
MINVIYSFDRAHRRQMLDAKRSTMKQLMIVTGTIKVHLNQRTWQQQHSMIKRKRKLSMTGKTGEVEVTPALKYQTTCVGTETNEN